jgi:uncharacterized protein (DUF362 family)
MKTKVAVLRTSPKTVLADYARLLSMAGIDSYIHPDRETCLNMDISWSDWYPGSSTEPWQLDGVLAALIDEGIKAESIFVCEKNLGYDPRQAEDHNGLSTAANRHGVRFRDLDGPDVSWIPYVPDPGLPALEKMLGGGGIPVPETLLGNNIINLPTMKTHSSAAIAGAAVCAFDTLTGGENEPADINAVLVDILALQQQLCGGVFTVTDGTICGDGDGPRMIVPFEKDYILAGGDPVAVDAVAAAMMGFQPMDIGYIRIATERGIGQGDIGEISIEGEDVSRINFHFKGSSRKIVPRHGFYLDYLWFPFKGWRHIGRIAETDWGQLLQEYLPDGSQLELQGKGKGPAIALGAAAALLGAGITRRMARAGRGGA